MGEMYKDQQDFRLTGANLGRGQNSRTRVSLSDRALCLEHAQGPGLDPMPLKKKKKTISSPDTRTGGKTSKPSFGSPSGASKPAAPELPKQRVCGDRARRQPGLSDEADCASPAARTGSLCALGGLKLGFQSLKLNPGRVSPD